jgi:hypothetical protein
MRGSRWQVTLVGEPLPAVGTFVSAQAVPELWGEEASPQQHWSGEIKQVPEVAVLPNGQMKWVLAGLVLWVRRAG